MKIGKLFDLRLKTKKKPYTPPVAKNYLSSGPGNRLTAGSSNYLKAI